jgi:hypothetical protein
MTPSQQTAYFAFINGEPGLSKYAGKVTPRNAGTAPFQNRLDLRFVQQLPTYRKVKLEFALDFINFGAFIARGVFNYVQEINTSTTNGGLTRQFGNASYTSTGLVKPTITTDAAGNFAPASGSVIQPNNGDSRWKIQAGLHLTF